ncbi:MAG: hypothetical protein AAF685_13535, partial [Cyanobacteria bacterium P01_C01_bin.89]
MFELSASEKKRLKLAIVSCYRSIPELKMFVAEELQGLKLERICSDQSLTVTAFELIEYCEAKGILDKLFQSLVQAN